MKKMLFMAIGFLPLLASAQTILSDDFESYTAGQLLAANSDIWSTWSGGIDAEDAYVSSDQASSGSNSVHVIGNIGPTDLYLPFPENYTSGAYEFSLKMYIVSGKGGYFNLQQSSTPGVNWMFEIYFDNAGGGYINGGGLFANITYTPDTWTDITVKVNLDIDYAECWINSNFIQGWKWSLGALGTGAEKMFGGVDIFAYAANGEDAEYYVDDVSLSIGTSGTCVISAPSFLSTLYITDTKAVLTWGYNAASKYKVTYSSKQGSSSFTTKQLAYHITGLTPNTTYVWRVEAFCGSPIAGVSAWSEKVNFTTASERLEEATTAASLNVYPNPVSSVATIAFSLAKTSSVTAELFTVDGKKVQVIADGDFSEGDHTISMNRESLTSGLYILQFKTGDDLITRKLVIE